MLTCSRCGKMLPDDDNACGHCGAARDLPAESADAELSDSDAPDLDEGPDGEGAIDEDDGDEHVDRPLTEAGLATVMLRLLGVYFTAFGAIRLAEELCRLVVYANKSGLEKAMQHYTLDYFAYAVGLLLVGLYLLLGGQWVFDKILTPVRRRAEEGEFEDSDEEETE